MNVWIEQDVDIINHPCTYYEASCKTNVSTYKLGSIVAVLKRDSEV